MGYVAPDGTCFRKPRTNAEKAQERLLADVVLGVADPVLHYRDALALIFGRPGEHSVPDAVYPHSYDTFDRLTKGIQVGGRIVTLRTVARPGSRRVLKSQAELFSAEYEAAEAAGEKYAEALSVGEAPTSLPRGETGDALNTNEGRSQGPWALKLTGGRVASAGVYSRRGRAAVRDADVGTRVDTSA